MNQHSQSYANAQELSNQANAADVVSISDILSICRARWYWFIPSIFIIVGLAAFYILSTPKQYTRTSSVLIKEEGKNRRTSSIAGELNAFADMGLFSGGSNVHNELRSINSISLISQVIERLHLDMDYAGEGKFRNTTLYGRTLPVMARISGLSDEDDCSWKMTVSKDGRIGITDIVLNKEELTQEGDIYKGQVGKAITTPAGKITIEKTPYFADNEYPTIFVTRRGRSLNIDYYLGKLNVELADKLATILNMTFNDYSIERSDDFLNTLVAIYNENQLKSKVEVALNTSKFLNERLAVIEKDLDKVDNDISSYKSEHQIADVATVASMYMTLENEANAKVTELNNQLYMTTYVRNYVSKDAKDLQLMPANLGIDRGGIDTQIGEYNTKLLRYNSLKANSSLNNPLIADLESSLISMKKNILSALDNHVASLNKQIATYVDESMKNMQRVTSSPEQAKYLITVERQQKVKESLYLYLLQKREENELSQTFEAYNTQVINPPHGSRLPSSPKTMSIMIGALLVGLLLPAGIFYMLETMNTKVRGRKDLEKITIPFIAEIPLAPQKMLSFGKKSKKDDNYIVVQKGSRDVMNEAFRVLRTNLEFISRSAEHKNVIAITSFNPGSGKSFISSNIVVSLGITEKKILLIDGDLRHASASKVVGRPKKGISNYLNGSIDDIEKIKVKLPGYENVDVIPVGTLPPNPAELLLDKRFAQLIEMVRQQYDYVFIDCPPIGLVADTQIINEHTDRTVFILRAGLLERSMLPELETIYNEKKYKNMSIVLNAIKNTGNRYGYRYGYHGRGSYYYNK
ncbi:MAG: polysaccharide biosynthesis tyrosine autokinase [Bacteroidaceae bacterium]|nr:polysaccharide biosynthesis tyrosine autokinase [Bacteroidaceae bacterium]